MEVPKKFRYSRLITLADIWCYTMPSLNTKSLVHIQNWIAAQMKMLVGVVNEDNHKGEITKLSYNYTTKIAIS